MTSAELAAHDPDQPIYLPGPGFTVEAWLLTPCRSGLYYMLDHLPDATGNPSRSRPRLVWVQELLAARVSEAEVWADVRAGLVERLAIVEKMSEVEQNAA